MSLFRDALGEAAKALLPQPGAGTWGGRISMTLPGERDYRSVVGDGMSNSIVAASVLWLARNFPKAPVMLEKRDGEGVLQRVREHPFLDLMESPNPFYSGVLLWWALIVSFLTDGNAYKVKRRNDADRVVEEWYVPHWMMEPKWPPDGRSYLSHYEYSPGTGLYKLRTEDVVHYRYGLDPSNTRKGMSPLKPLLREVYTDEEAARFTAALLHNLGMPGVILSPGGDTVVEPNEAEAVKAKYQQEFGGDKRGSVLVMTGNTNLTTVGFNPQELDLGRLREIPEERVTATLGVQAAVVGFGSGLQQTKVGATMRELRAMSWEDGMFPLHLLLCADMRAQELSEYESDLRPWVVAFDTSNVPELQESEDERAKRWSALVGGPIATRAEGREAFDLPTSDADDVYLQPISLIETPQQKAKRGTVEVKGQKAEPRDARYLRSLDRAATSVQGPFADELEAAFVRLGERAQLAYVATGDGRQGRLAASRVPGEVKQTAEDREITARIIEAMRIEEWAESALGPIYTRYIGLIGEATFGAVSSRIGVDVGWDFEDPAAQAVIASGGTRLGLLDLEADTKAAIFRALEDARANGEGPIAIARRIRSEVPAGPFVNAGPKYRAELIARTETLHAQRLSTLAASQKAGFDEFVIFDARLGPTDAECEILNQQIVGLQEAHDLVGSEHPNGTRSFAPVPRTTAGRGPRESKGWEPEVRSGSNGDGVRCSNCGSKVAVALGPGSVVECRKCKTVNRTGSDIEGTVKILPDRVVIEPPAVTRVEAPEIDLRPLSDMVEDSIGRLRDSILGEKVKERRLIKDDSGRLVAVEETLASGAVRLQKVERNGDGGVERIMVE